MHVYHAEQGGGRGAWVGCSDQHRRHIDDPRYLLLYDGPLTQSYAEVGTLVPFDGYITDEHLGHTNSTPEDHTGLDDRCNSTRYLPPMLWLVSQGRPILGSLLIAR